MKDGAIRESAELCKADRAIKYILDRIQHDVDLRWLMLHTQGMALLVEAEAARLGVNVDDHQVSRDRYLGEGSPAMARIPRYMTLLDEHGIRY